MFAPPVAAASGSTWSSSGSTVRLSGIVRLGRPTPGRGCRRTRPGRPRRTRPGRRSSRRGRARGRPRGAARARASGRWACPSTAAFMEREATRSGYWPRSGVCGEFGLAAGNGEEVEPVARRPGAGRPGSPRRPGWRWGPAGGRRARSRCTGPASRLLVVTLIAYLLSPYSSTLSNCSAMPILSRLLITRGDLRVVGDRAALGLRHGCLDDHLARPRGRTCGPRRPGRSAAPRRCTGHHRLQDLQRGLVRLDRVGGGEQEALHLAVGVGRQAELAGWSMTCWKSLSGIFVSLARIAMTWEARLPSGIVTTVWIPVLRVQQRRPGQAGLHVAVEYEVPGLEAGRSLVAALGREHERAGARDHAVLEQRRGRAGRRSRRWSPGRSPSARSRPRRSRPGGSWPRDAVDVEAAVGERDDDDQQRDPRREPADRAAARGAGVAAVAAGTAVAAVAAQSPRGGAAGVAGIAGVAGAAARTAGPGRDRRRGRRRRAGRLAAAARLRRGRRGRGGRRRGGGRTASTLSPPSKSSRGPKPGRNESSRWPLSPPSTARAIAPVVALGAVAGRVLAVGRRRRGPRRAGHSAARAALLRWRRAS